MNIFGLAVHNVHTGVKHFGEAKTKERKRKKKAEKHGS